MIMEIFPITITTSSNYGVEIQETCILRLAKSGPTNLCYSFFYRVIYSVHVCLQFTLYLRLFVTAGGVRDRI